MALSECAARMMRVRAANLSDAPEVSRFVSDLTAAFLGPTQGPGGLENLLESMNVEATVTRLKEGYPHWLAFEEDVLIGLVSVKPPCHIYHLFVSSGRQRSGIGRLLLEEAFQFISQSSSGASITVNASLNAVEAYRRFGFTETSEVQDEGGVRFLPMSRECESGLD